VFAGGPVNLGDTVGASVVVCDGDFTARDVEGCLIVARGDVRIKGGGTDSQILASGVVTFGEKRLAKFNQIKQEATPLGFVKWFDPASVGVVVEKAAGGVKVKQADEGKPFARAGLRAGDLAVAADGKKIDSPESFRRLLRAKVVMGDELTLEVRRDGKPVKVTVVLSPPEPPKK
jgi:S1-C subfamily serine protease